MELTVDMLYQALRGDYPDVRLQGGGRSAPVRQILLQRGAGPLRKDVLYLRGNCLFFDEREKGRLEFPGRTEELALLEGVLACRDRLLEWDNRICEDILAGRPPEDILPLAEPYLHYSYSLVDRDMHVVYESPYRPARDQALSEARDRNERYVPEESVRELMLLRSFHESARNRDCYYFRDTTIERNCYCRNIFVADRYHARLVLFLPDMDSRLSRGEEQLFAHFARRVEQLIQSRADFQRLPTADTLRALCRGMILGEEPDPARIRRGLDRTDWRYHHRFAVLALRLPEGGDRALRSEIALSYLAAELERRWRYGCAFLSGDTALAVLNLSLASGREEPKDPLPAFCEELAVFVREHACLAGVSSLCPDLSGLRRGAVQARVSLELGRTGAPSRWYHLFDNCRTEYMLDVLARYALPCLGPHPALAALAAYDREHRSELTATLRAYLDCSLNMQAAADRMHIHRTTFCRRMDHVREILRMELTPDNILQLALSLRLAERQEAPER